MNRGMLLVVAVAAAVSANDQPHLEHHEGTHPNQHVDLAGGHSSLQTTEYLLELVKSLGYNAVLTGDQVGFPVDGIEGQHTVWVRWGERSSLHVSTAWNSPQGGWEDAATINAWNHNRELTKVSIVHDEGQNRKSLVIMQLDQMLMLHREEDKAMAKHLADTAVKTFVHHAKSFDTFFVESYKSRMAEEAAMGEDEAL